MPHHPPGIGPGIFGAEKEETQQFNNFPQIVPLLSKGIRIQTQLLEFQLFAQQMSASGHLALKLLCD